MIAEAGTAGAYVRHVRGGVWVCLVGCAAEGRAICLPNAVRSICEIGRKTCDEIAEVVLVDELERAPAAAVRYMSAGNNAKFRGGLAAHELQILPCCPHT